MMEISLAFVISNVYNLDDNTDLCPCSWHSGDTLFDGMRFYTSLRCRRDLHISITHVPFYLSIYKIIVSHH
jgi:hypothetical protein